MVKYSSIRRLLVGMLLIFLAPLSTLAENPYYMDQVVPPGQSFQTNYQGLFRFRFYKLGEWHEVTVDDRLPTRSHFSKEYKLRHF